MNKNPYTLVFGKEPAQYIHRAVQMNQILDSFLDEMPSQQIFVITGVRGAGKTVLMTEVSKKIASHMDWVVVELNPERDMLNSLAAKLSSDHTLAGIFQSAKINLSFFGFGVEIGGVPPITDIEMALTRMLMSLKKSGKKVLITVDEAVNTRNMRVFVSVFQILIRQDLPVFLLMTGLYENVHKLQNEKSLTFLYRAPKIELKPLNIGIIADNYQINFKIDREKALDMAKMTKGYAFAFQALGYFCWEQGVLSDAAVTDYKLYLEEYVYEKVWSELSANDKKICYGIAKTESGKISDIRSLLKLETNQFNPYRKRLIRKGLIQGDTYGYVSFALPLFESFVLENTYDK
jgi:hypothetical protein